MRASLIALAMFAVLCVSGQSFAQKSAVDKSALTFEKIFDPDHIVEIEIELPEADWDLIRNQSRTYSQALAPELVESPFTYVKANITIDGFRIEDAGIRKKGMLGSLDERRPSLKVDFSKFRDQGPVNGMTRLTLNNNKQDPSGVSQVLAYKLFRESGTVAPRCNLARVTVNGTYLGVYSNVESIKNPMLEREFGDGSGALFEGAITDFYQDRIGRFEEKNKHAKVDQLKQLIDTLAESPLDIEKVGEMIDIDAFVRFWAMESLIGSVDGYCSNQNNFFVYRNPSNNKFYFIPWGADSVFTETSPLPPYKVWPQSVHHQSILANRLYRDPKIRRLYQTTLMLLLKTNWDEAELVAEIARLEEIAGEHILSEFQAASQYKTNSFRKFIETRRDTIMSEFQNGPPRLKTRERTPAYVCSFGEAVIEFETTWFPKPPNKIPTRGDVTMEFVWGGESIEFTELGVLATPSSEGYADEPHPPTIVLMGRDAKDGSLVTIATGLTGKNFKPGNGGHVPIGGIVIRHGNRRMAMGMVHFDKTSQQEGETVSGKMQLSFLEWRGGKHLEYEEDQ